MRASFVALIAIVLAATAGAQVLVTPDSSKPCTVKVEKQVIDGRESWTTIISCEVRMSQPESVGGVAPGGTVRWCAEDNASDCLTLTSGGGELVTGAFTDAGKLYAEAIGYRRGDKISLAFRRLGAADTGFATLILVDGRKAEGRTFNPDGSQRWRGTYVVTTR